MYFKKNVYNNIDITFFFFRRILKGHSPFVADAEHIHHKLLKAGLSQKKTVAILTLLAICGGGLATYFTGTLKNYFIYIAVLLLIMIILSFISLRTQPKAIEPHEETVVNTANNAEE